MKQTVTKQLSDWKLGSTSTAFETAGKGVFAISTGIGDNGGASYGTYQLSSKKETLRNFLNSKEHGEYGRYFVGLTPATPEFNAKWLEVAKSDANFGKHQHQFIHDTHYVAQLNRLSQSNLSLTERGAAVQDMVWSTSVQFGGSTSLVENALRSRYGAGVKMASLTDADIINAVQDYKVANNASLFAKSSDAVRVGTLKRANAERDKLLELLGLENIAKSSSTGGSKLVEAVAPTVNDTGINMCVQALPGEDVGYAWCVIEEKVKTGLFGSTQTRTSFMLRDESTGRSLASVCTADDILFSDSVLKVQHKSGQLSSGAYAFWSDWSTSQLLGNALNLSASKQLGGFSGGGFSGSGSDFSSGSLSLLPIGAFYESRSLAIDKAAAIADRTFRIVASGAASGTSSAAVDVASVTIQTLHSRDVNRDGVLNKSELDGLMAWSDSDEDGLINPATELVTLSSHLHRLGMGSFNLVDSVLHALTTGTGGNLPVNAHAVAVAAGQGAWWQLEQASDFSRLRSNDSIFMIDGQNFIRWEPGQIKLSSDSRNLVGTDSADVFDIGYYAAYDGRYFNLSRVAAFHGGGGNDSVGGSARNDSLFAGSGNDTLLGYAGNDSLFGEAGDDLLIGQDGNDWLHGGEGKDLLGGLEGNDTLFGGNGADELQGGAGDDLLDGGDGNDLLIAESGNDVLIGAAGHDEMQGGAGTDILLGGVGDDRLFGQVGDDTLYGGDGNDHLTGFNGSNEAVQQLLPGQTDADWLFGGQGADTLSGGLGNDWLDGGAGADIMEGGAGNDTYIVNSVNDVTLEQTDSGIDSVYTSVSTLLAANVENLRLLEGFSIHGTGNAQNNYIRGNSANNILDGVTGADTLEGGAGNDTYYIDNAGDRILEILNAGTDTVYASVSHALGEHIENLTLLDFSKPEKGVADGVDILVYGYPKAYELDYMQGNANPAFRGTCALTSIANVATQAQMPLSERQVLDRAVANQLCVSDPVSDAFKKGGSNFMQQQALLSSFGLRNGLLMGYDENAIANLIRGGRGVIMAMNAGNLWGDERYRDGGGVNHVVTLTGVACNAGDGSINGFYIADSGRGMVSDMTRYLSLADFRAAANVGNAYAIYTQEPIKLWNEDLSASGNSLSNQIVGNRGCNRISGGRGNDVLNGMTGDDTYVFSRGDGRDTLTDSDALRGNTDTLQFTDVRQTNLWFSRTGSDLQIRLLGGTDNITVRDWFMPGTSGADNQLERIRTADGLTLYNTDISRMVETMAAFAPPPLSQTAWRPGDVSNGKVLMTVSH